MEIVCSLKKKEIFKFGDTINKLASLLRKCYFSIMTSCWEPLVADEMNEQSLVAAAKETIFRQFIAMLLSLKFD